MSRWIPPIPSGKLTSAPARKVGAAIVFLHWCYDAVRRDGTIEFQIGEVAEYLDESYYTVQKWWTAVRGGPWFAEVIDRGKRGFVVRMADDWLEWRSVKSPSNAGQVPDVAFQQTEHPVKSPSNGNEMPDLALDLYIGTSDESDSPLPSEVGAALPAPSPAPRKSHAKKRESDPNQQHPACIVFAELTGKRPNRVQAAAIADTITPACVPRWRETMQAWLGAGWNSQNVTGMLDKYRKGARNGTTQIMAPRAGVVDGHSVQPAPATAGYRPGGAAGRSRRGGNHPVSELQPANRSQIITGGLQRPPDEAPE